MNLLKEKKLFVIYFLVSYMLLSSLALIIFYVFFNNEREFVIENLKKSEMSKVSIKNEIILTELNNIKSNILLISKQNVFLDYVSYLDKVEVNKENLDTDFNNLFKYVKKYSKAVYFDLDGKQKYKISINNDKIEENIFSLKNELLSLHENDVYISNFELNEKKLKPYLKLITSVWCKKNSKKGFLALDYLGESLILELNKLSRLLSSNIMLLNRDSYSLITMKKGEGWGFIFNKSKEYKFSSLHPKEWDLINKSDSSQFFNKEGLFTSRKIYFTDSSKAKYWVLLSYILNKDIHQKSMMNNIFMIFLLLGNIFLALSFAFIISRRRVYLEKLEYSANYDLLTNLPNRALFYSYLKEQYTHSNRYDDKFALLFIDLDGFKEVNDTYGHESGDEVLKITAKRLSSFIRNSDIAARLGGDEFTIILMNVNHEDDVKIISEKIIKKLSKSISIKGYSISIGASIGIYIYDRTKSISVDEIIQNSDKAMYMAKNSGKNRYYFSKE